MANFFVQIQPQEGEEDGFSAYVDPKLPAAYQIVNRDELRMIGAAGALTEINNARLEDREIVCEPCP